MDLQLTVQATTLPATPRTAGRVPGIDVLRGRCILAVVLHHINLRIRLDQLTGPFLGQILFWSGYFGVRVFFVISGFLIASWSLKRWGQLSNIRFRQFYAMRFARIVPCLLGLLALLALLDRAGVPRFTIAAVPPTPGFAPHPLLGRALFAALTFHVNWLEGRTGYLPAAWDVLWSLSVEEVFYIFFPLVCAAVRRQALLVALLCGFVVAGPYARVVLTAHNPIWQDYSYLSCMDGIALGCLAALLCAKVRFGDTGNLSLRASGIALLLMIAVLRGRILPVAVYKLGLDVTLLELGTALLIVALQQRSESAPPEYKEEAPLSSRAEQASFVSDSRGESGPRAVEGSRRGADSDSLGAFRPRSLRFFWRRSLALPGQLLQWFGRNSYEIYLTHAFVMWPTVMLFQHLHQPLYISPLWFLVYAAATGALGALIARFYSEPLNRALRLRLSKPAQATSARGQLRAILIASALALGRKPAFYAR